MKKNHYLIILLLSIIFFGCSSKKEFNVESMHLIVRTDVDGFCFDVTSNLPDNTEFLVSLYKDNESNLLGQAKTKISNGSFTVGPYRNGNNLYGPGYYIVTVTVPSISLQDENVKKLLGKKGEFLTGKGVQDGISKELGKYIEQKFDFNVGEYSPLSFETFLSTYSIVAPYFAAKQDLNWIYEEREKYNVAGAPINDISSIAVYYEKDEAHKIKSVDFYVANKPSESSWNSLMVLYTLVKTIDQIHSTESIPDFVANILDTKTEKTTKNNIVTYKVKVTDYNTVVTMSY